jgi:membrane peptidoglycan carboxypeptidase
VRTMPRDATPPQEPENTQNQQTNEEPQASEEQLQPIQAEGSSSNSSETASSPLQTSLERTRQLLAARRSRSRPLAEGTAPDHQDSLAPESMDPPENGNGDAQRKRRRPNITRILGQTGEMEVPVLTEEAAPEAPAAAQMDEPGPMDLSLTLPDMPEEVLLPAAALEAPPTERQDALPEAALIPAQAEPLEQGATSLEPASPKLPVSITQEAPAPAEPTLSNGQKQAHISTPLLPAQEHKEQNGRLAPAEKPPRVTIPLLPEQDEASDLPKAPQQSNGHAKHTPEEITPDLMPDEPSPLSLSQPMPAIAIGRTGLVSERARRERLQRKHQEAQQRWKRRRRFLFYLKDNTHRRQQHHATVVHRTLLITAGLMTLLLAVVLGVTINIAYSFYQSESAALDNLPYATSRDNVQIFDSTGKLLHTITSDGVKHYIPLAEVSINVINATIAVEDKDFWINDGIDFTAILRAASDNLSSGEITSGASTITQQLIKNMVLSPDPTFDRKIKEAILAVGITQHYSKKQILEMYLNTIGYGENAYGIDAAALEYFNLHDQGNVSGASQLDLSQASMLAGLPKNPNIYDPFVNRQVALQRQHDVLLAMVNQGYITDQERVQAETEAASPNFLKAPPQEPNLAPHFDYWVEEQLAQMVDAGTLRPGITGLRVYTTLDLDLQNKVQQLITDRLAVLRSRHVDNMAAVIIDQHTGAVVTMLGSADYFNNSIDGKYNVATLGYRQMGSSFKPITYATAFEKGWFPAQGIADGPSAFPSDGSPLGWYKPLNYNRNQMGEELTLRQALQNSLNIPAVKTLEFAGIDDTLNMAERLGVTDYNGQPGLSMTLGSLGMHLLDMVSVYSTFANYGVHNPPFGIWRITDAQDNTLYQYAPHGEQVLSPQVSYLITSVLTDNNTRANEFGFCNPLYLTPTVSGCRGQQARPAAAKTGTTEDFQDDLTIGYTMDLTMGLWAGNTDNSPTDILNGITGAAPVWHDAMVAAEGNRPYQDFPVPPGVEKRSYCGGGGPCTTDWFISGAIPSTARPNTGSVNKACIKVQPSDKKGDNWTVECPAPTPPPGGGGGGGGNPPPCPNPPCPPPPGNLSATAYGPTDHSPAAPNSSDSKPQPQFQLPPVGDVNRFGFLA